MSSSAAPTLAEASGSLVRLLGDARAQIVTTLREHAERTVAQLAEHLGISEVAVRRHLTVLERDGFVAAHTVKQGRGRPAARYALTDDAQRLFPHRYDRLASEVLNFLTAEHGRAGFQAFLRWRLDREAAGLRDAVTAEDLHERLEQLAGALSEAGFAASVEATADGFTLVQNNCTIADIAKEHPEVCAYEAAAFSRVLGRDVTLSRRDTLATGATACVCSVATKVATDQSTPSTEDRPSDAATSASAAAAGTKPEAGPGTNPSARAGEHQ